MLNFMWRNMKWRCQNPISILIPVLQPFIWLVLYSTVAGQTMQDKGIGNYTAFILPGIMVLVILASSCSGGIINFITKSNGSFYRILIAPVKRTSIVLGQMMESVVLSFIEVAILCITGLFFSVRIESGIVGIILMIILIFMTAFFMSGLCYAISLILPNEIIYETIMNAIVLPIFFLSSALFSIDNISGGLLIAVKLNPLTHVINALRSLIMGRTIIFMDILPVIILFVIMCIISFAFALKRLKMQTIN
ncbi:transport permease protein [Vallitalea longa]|uniref:Transport permease protein n=1 Tax=Vallitalea longa TaxID=2936439 RepID=A0A9W6DE28_9FIRM|nr:ABC transporter permease [Vallitalea longa]GKX29671.1 transport permease protein [Vallitalea longa]